MKKKILFTLFLIGLLSSIITIIILNYKFSEGVRSGRLVRVTQKGTFIKTYEGTLDLGAAQDLTWSFSIHRNADGKKMEQDIGKKITVNYVERFFRLWWDTPYDLVNYKIEEDDAQWQINFCKLVNLIRREQPLVERLRALMQEHATELLDRVRSCQQVP